MTTVAFGQGIHQMPASVYHEDPTERPSLSASIARILCTSSPAHAKTAHPRLTVQPVEDEPKFDVGTAAHSLFLEGDDSIVVVDAKDWRTKAAQEARFEARVQGRTPLLAHQWDEVQAMVEAAREQLAAHNATPPLFTAGRPEQTLVWEELGGVVCRARCDWLRDDRQAIDDLKTTSRTANPEAWTRSLFGMGYDIQAAFYLRGLRATTNVDQTEFRWCVQENYPPYALSVVSLGLDVLTLANKKVAYAIDVWRDCLADDDWPAYPRHVCYADLPAWEESRWLAKEERELL